MAHYELLINDEVFEKVEAELINEGEDVDKIRGLYRSAGGEETFDMWFTVYGIGIINDWEDNYNGLSTSTDDIIAEGVVHLMTNYIKWLKTLH